MPTSLPHETDPAAELIALIDNLRRAARLQDHAAATEETTMISLQVTKPPGVSAPTPLNNI